MNQLLSSLSPCFAYRFEGGTEGTDRLAVQQGGTEDTKV